jgi:hypothetical protein
MLKRRIKKLTKGQLIKHNGRHTLICKECNLTSKEVSTEISAYTCCYCVQKMIAPPTNYKKIAKSEKPRGWHFKMYFEQDGVVYSKGKEVTDPKEIANLRKSAKTATPKKTVAKKTTKTKVVKTTAKVEVPKVTRKKTVLKVKAGDTRTTKSVKLPKVTKKATKTSAKRGTKNARTTK